MNRDCLWLGLRQFVRLRFLLPDQMRGKASVDAIPVISGIVPVPGSGRRWVDASPKHGPAGQ
jgi:hypothetical protein